MVATFVLLTIIGTFALTRILGSDDPEPSAAATPSVSSEEGDPSPSDSSAAPSTSPSQTPEAVPSPALDERRLDPGQRPPVLDERERLRRHGVCRDRTDVLRVRRRCA